MNLKTEPANTPNPYDPPSLTSGSDVSERLVKEIPLRKVFLVSVIPTFAATVVFVGMHASSWNFHRIGVALFFFVLICFFQMYATWLVDSSNAINRFAIVQAANATSWAIVVGTLALAPYLLVKIPNLRLDEVGIFVGAAVVSGLLCLIVPRRRPILEKAYRELPDY